MNILNIYITILLVLINTSGYARPLGGAGGICGSFDNEIQNKPNPSSEEVVYELEKLTFLVDKSFSNNIQESNFAINALAYRAEGILIPSGLDSVALKMTRDTVIRSALNEINNLFTNMSLSKADQNRIFRSAEVLTKRFIEQSLKEERGKNTNQNGIKSLADLIKSYVDINNNKGERATVSLTKLVKRSNLGQHNGKQKSSCINSLVLFKFTM